MVARSVELNIAPNKDDFLSLLLEVA